MSIRDNSTKIVIKGSSEASPHCYEINRKQISTTLELWQLNILEAIDEKLRNDNGCEVWFSHMV